MRNGEGRRAGKNYVIKVGLTGELRLIIAVF
jgi:hypothetical protein